MNLIYFSRIQENGANKCTSKAPIKAINFGVFEEP